MAAAEHISNLTVVQAAKQLDLISNIVFVSHFLQKRHLRPITSYDEMNVRVLPYNLRDDQHHEVDALAESQPADANDIDCVDRGTQTWVRCESLCVYRIRYDVDLIRWNTRPQRQVLFVTVANSDAGINCLQVPLQDFV